MTLTPFPNPSPDTKNHRHPLLPTPEELATLSRNLNPLLGLSTVPPTPTAMVPDTAGSAGLITSGRAYGDHRHNIPTVAPGALARTSLNSEGAGVSFVRDDHQHSTAALGWGVMPNRFLSTSATAALATGTTTDMSVTNTYDSTRAYMLFGIWWFLKSAAEGWEFDLMQDGVLLEKIGQTASATTTADRPTNPAIWYEPTSGSHTLAIRVTRTTGTGTITLSAGATQPRRLWVVDVGPR